MRKDSVLHGVVFACLSGRMSPGPKGRHGRGGIDGALSECKLLRCKLSCLQEICSNNAKVVEAATSARRCHRMLGKGFSSTVQCLFLSSPAVFHSDPAGSSHGVTPILPVAPMAAAVEYQAMAGGPENFRSTLRSSMMRANVFALESLFVLGCYGWMLLCPEVQWPGHTKNAWRCTLLFTFGVAYMLRLNAMARWLLPRELAQEELTVVILWIMSILVSFAVGALLKGTLDWMTCCLAVFLYCLGSWLNTWSELQRKWWKARAENKGRCYTLGLFSLSRNINYFGDVVLFLGWAVATGCWWNLWAPATMAASFYFYHIPDKDQYLSKRYSSDWPEYAASTKSFIPFVC